MRAWEPSSRRRGGVALRTCRGARDEARTLVVTATSNVPFADVKLDFKTYQATKAEQPLELTPREFSILRYFLDHPNEVVSRETLLNHVWGYDPSAFTRTVDTHMARLRQKIEPTPAEPRHLITVHRVGYKFVP